MAQPRRRLNGPRLAARIIRADGIGAALRSEFDQTDFRVLKEADRLTPERAGAAAVLWARLSPGGPTQRPQPR